jgi:hypothetical protein
MEYGSVEVPASFFGVPDSLFSNLTIDLNEEAKTATIIYVRVSVEHMGSFRRLLAGMEASPYEVHIYCPVRRTRGIIARLGYGPLNPDIWAHGYPADNEDIKYGMSNEKYAKASEAVYDVYFS